MSDMENVLNSKVAIINKDGIICLMGRNSRSCSHVKCLLDYLEKNYPSLDISKLKIGSSRDYYGYIFGKLGNVIYFNDGETGMFYFPSELTDKQVDALYNLDLGKQKAAIGYYPNESKLIKYLGLSGEFKLNEVFEHYLDGAYGKGKRRR